MGLEPRMHLSDTHVRLQKRAELAARVEALAVVDQDLGEFGLLDSIKKKAKKLLGKDDKPKPPKSKDFDEKKHPRGPDGRFAEAPAARGPGYIS